MKIIPVTHSSIPRIGERPEEQKLRRAFSILEEGKITKEDFAGVENQLVDDILLLQEGAGLEIVTDGLVRWHDPVSHLARNLKGFEINGLLRFFDTNFYYRQPIATEKIAFGNGAITGEIEYLTQHSSRPAKAVMLGPLSLAAMSLNKTSIKFEDFCLKLGDILGQLAFKLVAAGAQYIQVEEPWLARNPEHFDLFLASFAKIAGTKRNSKLILALYFGDAGKIYKRMPEIPADILGIDFTYSPGLLEKMAHDRFPKSVAFGILDARNTKLEAADSIARDLEPVLKNIGADECHITTSCGLEYLPRIYAVKKLELTAQIAKKLNG